MTDTTGQRHKYTLPVGTMRPAIWAAQCAHACQVLSAQLAELVCKVALPFVSTVTSIASPRAVFVDGRLLLVGDALAQFRPHVGSSTNHAALDALLLQRALRGEIGLQQWEEQVMGICRSDEAAELRLRKLLYGWLPSSRRGCGKVSSHVRYTEVVEVVGMAPRTHFPSRASASGESQHAN
jgi:flavin-dependent dehydrogenase